MNMKTSELHASCCLGSHKSYWKIKRIRSTALPLKAKQFTSQLPIISSYEETFPQLPCVITGIFIDCQVYILSSVVYIVICSFTAVDAVSGSSKLQSKKPGNMDLQSACRLEKICTGWSFFTHHRMVELNIGFIHSNMDRGPWCEYKQIHIPVSSKGWSKSAPYKKHPESTPYFLRVILMGTARTNPWMILDLRYFYNWPIPVLASLHLCCGCLQAARAWGLSNCDGVNGSWKMRPW